MIRREPYAFKEKRRDNSVAQDLAAESGCIKCQGASKYYIHQNGAQCSSLLRPVGNTNQNKTMPESYQAKRIKQVDEITYI